jgi:hypothetical protein
MCWPSCGVWGCAKAVSQFVGSIISVINRMMSFDVIVLSPSGIARGAVKVA